MAKNDRFYVTYKWGKHGQKFWLSLEDPIATVKWFKFMAAPVAGVIPTCPFIVTSIIRGWAHFSRIRGISD